MELLSQSDKIPLPALRKGIFRRMARERRMFEAALRVTLLQQFEAAEPPTATCFNLQTPPAGLQEDI